MKSLVTQLPPGLATLDLLEKRWPGAVAIPLAVAAEALSVSRQTAYNQHCAGRFPVHVVKMGRKPIVLLVDLADFLDGQRGVGLADAPDLMKKEKRGPGRPRKYPDAKRSDTNEGKAGGDSGK